jgi:hypothetical protein
LGFVALGQNPRGIAQRGHDRDGRSDPKEAAVILSHDLNQDQLEMIRGERKLYFIGVLLLAAAFALSFLRELV